MKASHILKLMCAEENVSVLFLLAQTDSSGEGKEREKKTEKQ